MPAALVIHPDRLFPAEPSVRGVARRLYEHVRALPIVSPHGHTEARWFALDEPFSNAFELLVAPDHYLYRMLYSQGVSLETLGIGPAGTGAGTAPREAWREFARHYRLFRGTPSRVWLDQVFHELFGLAVVLEPATADLYFDTITAALACPPFRPRALYERFNIEVLATTDSPVDSLEAHRAIRASGWSGRVITTYRPDVITDPQHESFASALRCFGELTGEDVFTWNGYLRGHRVRRAAFAALGATATDHGPATCATADLDPREAARLFGRILSGRFSAGEAEQFRAQMLTEMARMSLEDGLVMQIHPGVFRNHNRQLFQSHGRDRGADIPQPTDYVHALKPLLDRYGNDPRLTLIVFTLDESAYSRELAPLAGHYPALRLGPAWWFHDSPEGLRRFREQTTETAGFYNTVGFNDDTRAFLSIPARHDVARRIDCGFLGRLVAEHRLEETEALDLAVDLAYRLAKQAYRL